MNENSSSTESVSSENPQGKRWIGIHKINGEYVLTARYDVDYKSDTFFTEIEYPYAKCKNIVDVLGYINDYLRD